MKLLKFAWHITMDVSRDLVVMGLSIMMLPAGIIVAIVKMTKHSCGSKHKLG